MGNQGGSNRGRGLRRSNSYFTSMKFYNYGQIGHPKFRFLDKPSHSNHGKSVAYTQEDNSNVKEPEVDHIELEKGENFMFR